MRINNSRLYVITVIISVLLFYEAEVSAIDRGRIVYASMQSGSWELWSIKHDGTEMKRLTTTSQDEHSPSVSPDGKELAYVNQEREIWVMKMDGSSNARVPLPDGIYAQPTWFPDGSGIAFVRYGVVPRDTSDIWMVKRGDQDEWREPERISSYPPMRLYPSFSPDGSKLAYSEFTRDEYQNVIEEIGILDIAKGIFEKITSLGADSYDPAWSPAGEQIVYASDRGGNYDIWVMLLADGVHRQLTTDPSFDGEPVWSPDGHEVAFVSNRSGRRELWIISVTGDSLRQLTKNGSSVKDPFWVK